MTIVAIVCGALLSGAAILALVRAERGPSMLDRTIALDVFVTAIVGAVVLESAFSGRTDTLPLLVVLSLVAFVGSVTIARFAAVEPEGEGRVRTVEEIATEEAALRRAEDEALLDEARLEQPLPDEKEERS
ncbi:monovalent cation/H+ antiporter complex subunit F [Sanguibacter sp. 25GB23B1]|uniref:monovalent cation/H+ antiporter complex subunit F n=1 Tax=unclassified Sanguibacter TaxID=2645534 RepID=UPI0032AFC2B5